ncbi:hypothetical protein GQR58_025758 [Nymphon striatum]|nr:hypothetical protein GQR58_025758 [Nymphon striatum]
MSDSERSGDYSVHLRYISPELSDIYVDEEKKITDESAAESILVLEPYMFEPYETENENTCLNVIQSRKLKGRLVGHRTSKYGMVMPLVIESWCCREIEEVHCETVRTQQDVLFIVETNSFRIQIVAWMQMFSVAQTMHTSTNMAGMHSNMSKIAVPKKRLLRDYPLLQFHTPFCRNKSQLVFVNIWHPRQSWNSYQRLHWNLRQNYLQKTSTRATLKCLENRTRTIYDAGIIIYHAIEDVCGVSDPWPPTFSSFGIDAVEACVPSPLYKLLAGVLVPMTSYFNREALHSIGLTRPPVFHKPMFHEFSANIYMSSFHASFRYSARPRYIVNYHKPPMMGWFLKIQFNDKNTSTFEYPSEAYLESESSSPSPTDHSVIPYADDDESDSKDENLKPKSEQEKSPSPVASPVNETSTGSGLKSNPALGSSTGEYD